MSGSRYDDIVLAGILLLISVPRAILAAYDGQPLGAEGTISLVLVALGLAILEKRN